jgi:NDP-sugar pyrophosphorylase family protein
MSCCYIGQDIRKYYGDPNDDMDIRFIEFEKTAEAFKASLLFVQLGAD